MVADQQLCSTIPRYVGAALVVIVCFWSTSCRGIRMGGAEGRGSGYGNGSIELDSSINSCNSVTRNYRSARPQALCINVNHMTTSNTHEVMCTIKLEINFSLTIRCDACLQDVAVDAEANVYVADTGNHRIRRITPEVG